MSQPNDPTRRPRVSIGLPVYNGERYLAEAVDSLLAQTLADFELVLVDNASTDRTADMCRAYAARDPRVRYHRNEQNIGATRNFNRAFELARAPLFKWAAADDRHAPTFLERAVAVMDAEPGVVLVYGKTQLIDERGRAVEIDRINDDVPTRSLEPQVRFEGALAEIWCVPIFGLMRTAVLRTTPLHRTFYSSDKVLLAELSLKGQFHRVDEVLFYRRCHEEQSTTMSTRARALWAVPAASAVVPFQLRAFVEYLKLARAADLTAYQRTCCYLSVARLLVSLDKWKKLVLPGPYNYLGFDPFRNRRVSKRRVSRGTASGAVTISHADELELQQTR